MRFQATFASFIFFISFLPLLALAQSSSSYRLYGDQMGDNPGGNGTLTVTTNADGSQTGSFTFNQPSSAGGYSTTSGSGSVTQNPDGSSTLSYAANGEVNFTTPNGEIGDRGRFNIKDSPSHGDVANVSDTVRKRARRIEGVRGRSTSDPIL